MDADQGASPVHHILSYGGGVNSVALMILLIQEGLPLDGVVFADSGGEVPETYTYLDIAREYLAPHRVELTVVSKTGLNLYDTCWKREVIPSTLWRWSTRDAKVTPILRHYRSLGGHVNQYLAIARDEAHRMKDSRVEYVTNLYPLIERKLTRDDCVSIITEAGLPLPPKSACFFCPFSSHERWRWLHHEHPDLFEKAVALEEHGKHFPAQRLSNIAYRDRQDITLRTLGELFRSGTPLPVLQQPDEAICGAECMT